MQWLKDDRGKLNPRTEPILEAATKFFWSEEMQESLDSFCANYADLFADVEPPKPATGLGFQVPQPVQAAMPQGEQRLEWTETYERYAALIEQLLEDFCAMKQTTAEAVFTEVRRVMMTGGLDEEFLPTALRICEYDHFIEQISLVAYFQDMAPNAGCTQILPGSHRQELPMPSADAASGGEDGSGVEDFLPRMEDIVMW